MFNGLEYVKETIDLRKEDIENNEFETNNLLLDDILIALGYNKRREPGVKALYSGNADWEIIYNGETRFIVAVYGYNSVKPTLEQLTTAFEFADANGFIFTILTDGKRLSIYEINEEIVYIEDIFDDTSDEVLNALSKVNWNPDFIRKIKVDNALTIKNVVDSLNNNIKLIAENVLDSLNVSHTDEAIDKASRIVYDTINNFDSKEDILPSNKLDTNKDEEISNLNTKIATLETYIKDKETVINEHISKIKDLEADNSELNTTKLKLETELSELKSLNSELTTKLTEIETIKLDIEASNSELKQKNSELQHLLEKVQETKDLEDDRKNIEGYDESAYRDKIASLIEDKQKLTVELTEYKDKLTELERKQAGDEDKQIVMARQLLEAVEDNEELNRTYVGVVNSKLFQIGEITKFVGTCLQELYSAVSFELMHLLFDGDIFKIVQPAVRNDLLINTKTYDIDLSDLSEEEVISRLKTLFNKFSNVVFMCKTIGTYKEPVLNIDEQYNDLDNIDVDAEEIDFEDSAFKSGDFEEVQEFNSDEAIITESENIEISNQLLGLALCDVGSVLWSEDNPIKTICAISDGIRTFNIFNSNYEDIIKDTVSSLLAICESSIEALNTLRNTNLTSLSATIHKGQESDNDIQILDTEYYTDVDNMQKCISMLLAMADALYLDTTQIYMYFEANSIVEGLESNYIDRNTLDLDNEFSIDELEPCTDVIHCILSGNSILNIQNIEYILNIENKAIGNAIAVRTAYMTNALRSNIDIAKSVATCLARAEIDEIPDIIDRVNRELKYEVNVILKEDEEHSEDAIEFTAGTSIYYIDTMPGYLTTLLLIKLHNIIMNDGIIDVRVELNSTVYQALKNGMNTSSAYECLAGKLFAEITDGKTKIITK